MALQKTVFVTGKLANIIFYEFRGTPCGRTMPAKVRQTKATKASAKQFGKAATLSKLLRQLLTPVLPDPLNKKMMYRLNATLAKWLRSDKSNAGLSHLEGFEFNVEALIKEIVRKSISIDWTTKGKVILKMPDLVPVRDIAAPFNTRELHWQIMVVSITHKERPSIRNSYTSSINMAYDSEPRAAENLSIPFIINSGDLTVVAVALQYTSERKGELVIVGDKRWKPANILGLYCG